MLDMLALSTDPLAPEVGEAFQGPYLS